MAPSQRKLKVDLHFMTLSCSLLHFAHRWPPSAQPTKTYQSSPFFSRWVLVAFGRFSGSSLPWRRKDQGQLVAVPNRVGRFMHFYSLCSPLSQTRTKDHKVLSLSQGHFFYKPFVLLNKPPQLQTNPNKVTKKCETNLVSQAFPFQAVPPSESLVQKAKMRPHKSISPFFFC